MLVLRIMEQKDLEASRRASLLNEEARQMMAREQDAWVSIFVLEVVESITIEGADTGAGTNEGVSIEAAGPRKSDPPAF